MSTSGIGIACDAALPLVGTIWSVHEEYQASRVQGEDPLTLRVRRVEKAKWSQRICDLEIFSGFCGAVSWSIGRLGSSCSRVSRLFFSLFRVVSTLSAVARIYISVKDVEYHKKRAFEAIHEESRIRSKQKMVAAAVGACGEVVMSLSILIEIVSFVFAITFTPWLGLGLLSVGFLLVLIAPFLTPLSRE